MRYTLLAAALLVTPPSLADERAFAPGPLIEDFGPVAAAAGAKALPQGVRFMVSYDGREGAEPGALNKTLTSAARFLNMHAAAGVDPERMKLAVVLHGKAVRDVVHTEAYAKWHDAANANLPLIKALTANGVKIYLCGQSAVYYDVTAEDLAPGVEMALSAMTVHALLQQEGYTLNPF